MYHFSVSMQCYYLVARSSDTTNVRVGTTQISANLLILVPYLKKQAHGYLSTAHMYRYHCSYLVAHSTEGPR